MKNNYNKILSLAIETSSSNISIAIFENNIPIASYSLRGNAFASSIPNMFDSLINNFNINKKLIKLICIDIGPGAFTSLRSGISFARALAQFGNYSIVSTSAFDVIYQNVAPLLSSFKLQHPVLVLIDAKQNQFYASLFHNNTKIFDNIISDLNSITISVKQHIKLNDSIIVLSPNIILIKEYFSKNNSIPNTNIIFMSDYFNYPNASSLAYIGFRLFEKGNNINYQQLNPLYKKQYL